MLSCVVEKGDKWLSNMLYFIPGFSKLRTASEDLTFQQSCFLMIHTISDVKKEIPVTVTNQCHKPSESHTYAFEYIRCLSLPWWFSYSHKVFTTAKVKTIDKKWKYFHAYFSFCPRKTEMPTGYWAFCELPNLNNVYRVSAHLQLVLGFSPRCQNGQVWRGLPTPIYHRGYRNSTAISLLPLWAITFCSRMKCTPISICVIVPNTVSCNISTHFFPRHVWPNGVALPQVWLEDTAFCA